MSGPAGPIQRSRAQLGTAGSPPDCLSEEWLVDNSSVCNRQCPPIGYLCRCCWLASIWGERRDFPGDCKTMGLFQSSHVMGKACDISPHWSVKSGSESINHRFLDVLWCCCLIIQKFFRFVRVPIPRWPGQLRHVRMGAQGQLVKPKAEIAMSELGNSGMRPWTMWWDLPTKNDKTTLHLTFFIITR